MPRGIYSNLRCKSSEKTFTPLQHQEKVRDYFLTSKYKGLLLFHELGSGKTCTAIITADAMLKQGLVESVIVFTPGSLRATWLSEYCDKCGKSDKYLKQKYTFITYNYNVSPSLPSLNNTLVIIDEVHNLINAVKNNSRNAKDIFSAIENADCRVLALSGTPVLNYVNEYELLGKLLNPKNPEKLKGVISYYPGAGSEFIPKVVLKDPIKVQMSPEQDTAYWQRYASEIKLTTIPIDAKLKQTNPKKYEELSQLQVMARKNILSRSASNFYYPEGAKPLPDTLEEKGGWINDEMLSDGALMIYSPKFVALLLNIIQHIDQKHVIHTFFKDKAGAVLLKTLLKRCGFTVSVFSGDMNSSERTSMLRKFNSKKNKHGELVKILIITEAGAEGISLKEARHIHILESAPRIAKTIQAIGRVARYMSHTRLPPEEREINVWRYWSVSDPKPIKVTIKGVKGEKTTTITNKKTIDELLYERGQEKVKELSVFLEKLKQSSI